MVSLLILIRVWLRGGVRKMKRKIGVVIVVERGSGEPRRTGGPPPPPLLQNTGFTKISHLVFHSSSRILSSVVVQLVVFTSRHIFSGFPIRPSHLLFLRTCNQHENQIIIHVSSGSYRFFSLIRPPWRGTQITNMRSYRVSCIITTRNRPRLLHV